MRPLAPYQMGLAAFRGLRAGEAFVLKRAAARLQRRIAAERHAAMRIGRSVGEPVDDR